MLAISVLGSVELHGDGRLLALPAGKTTEILVRLALDAMVTVSAAVSAGDLDSAIVGAAPAQADVTPFALTLTAMHSNKVLAESSNVVRMKPCSSSLPSAQVWKDHARLFNGQVVHQWSNLTSHMCLDVSEASQAPAGTAPKGR